MSLSVEVEEGSLLHKYLALTLIPLPRSHLRSLLQQPSPPSLNIYILPLP